LTIELQFKICTNFKTYCARTYYRIFWQRLDGFWSNKLLRTLRNTGSTRRRQGSGRPHSTRTDDNVDSVNELIVR